MAQHGGRAAAPQHTTALQSKVQCNSTIRRNGMVQRHCCGGAAAQRTRDLIDLEADGHALAVHDGAELRVAGAVVPGLAPHPEAVEVNGDAWADGRIAVRHSIDDGELQDIALGDLDSGAQLAVDQQGGAFKAVGRNVGQSDAPAQADDGGVGSFHGSIFGSLAVLGQQLPGLCPRRGLDLLNRGTPPGGAGHRQQGQEEPQAQQSSGRCHCQRHGAAERHRQKQRSCEGWKGVLRLGGERCELGFDRGSSRPEPVLKTGHRATGSCPLPCCMLAQSMGDLRPGHIFSPCCHLASAGQLAVQRCP
jgi:hypothetical protein